MVTQCTQQRFGFQRISKLKVEAQFNGGSIVSDGGGLLLREVEKRTGILQQFARLFSDGRDPSRIEHSCWELLAQRIYALALGYEDLNDHDLLREDLLLATLVEKEDPTGQHRRCRQDQGKALAGKSTLNRLELYEAGDRYKKIRVDWEASQRFFVHRFLESFPQPTEPLILDLDATDDPLHGAQEGRFFHGYYNCYCYLPLYIFCQGFPLWAELRSSNIDASAGAVEALEIVVAEIQTKWPEAEIWIRGDSGFARQAIMAWCEDHQVDYVLGLAKNSRLIEEIEPELEHVASQYEQTQEPTRTFAEFLYRTRKSWSRSRRVIAKAEHLSKGRNPRFVVTSLSSEHYPARDLYEQIYCARGDVENRIKEQQLALFAGRTSSSKMAANQLRLWFATVAYLLVHQLRRLGLEGTSMARAQCDTIRLRLLKIGSQVRISIRRIFFSMASGYPHADLFAQVHGNLIRAGPVLT